MNRRISKTLSRYRSLLLLIIIMIVAICISPDFLSVNNIKNIMLQISVNGMVAIGMTVVVITGGFDLSVGSVMALAGVVVMKLLPLGLVPAILLGILAGVLVGILNGVMVGYVGINPFIASLGSMASIRGLVLGMTDARPISFYNEGFSFLGTGYWGIFPISIIFLAIMIAAVEFYLKQTKNGRYIYVCGSNFEAGHLAGISMKKVLLKTYTICAAIAAIAGIWLAARLNTGSPVIAEDAALLAITAVILGGTSLAGGAGSVLKTTVGILILGLLSNTMNLMEIASYYQILIKGLLVVIVVAIDAPGLRRIFKLLAKKRKVK